MPIEVGIWCLGDKPEKITLTPLSAESKLEDALAQDLSILSLGLLLLGRQVQTDYGKIIDLLAMNADGNVLIIELKRDKTPREVVAQAIDYASWVQELTRDEIAAIYEAFCKKKFEEGFADAFGVSPPEKINQNHSIFIVTTELDPSTERIINYLVQNYGVPINAVFFGYFKDGSKEYLTRTWLIDPQEAEVQTSKVQVKKGSESWNGRDFYVSIGPEDARPWEDYRKYGYVSGGGGKWYSQTLKLLFPGARVFANLPGYGYVGVGIVKEAAVPLKDFKVTIFGKLTPILEVPLKAPTMKNNPDDMEHCEYFVRVEWKKTLPKEAAYWEKGLFAIQHTACRMKNSFTIEKLVKHFGLED